MPTTPLLDNTKYPLILHVTSSLNTHTHKRSAKEWKLFQVNFAPSSWLLRRCLGSSWHDKMLLADLFLQGAVFAVEGKGAKWTLFFPCHRVPPNHPSRGDNFSIETAMTTAGETRWLKKHHGCSNRWCQVDVLHRDWQGMVTWKWVLPRYNLATEKDPARRNSSYIRAPSWEQQSSNPTFSILLFAFCSKTMEIVVTYG